MHKKQLQQATYGIAIFNLFSAFIYSIAIVDKFHIEEAVRIGIQVSFVVLFLILELRPKISIVPAIAAGFMNSFMACSLLSNIGKQPIRIISQVIAVIILILIELTLFIDTTIEDKDNLRTPTMQELKAQGYKKTVQDGVTIYRKD